MTDAEARAWIEARFGTTAVERLARFAALVRDEAARQNLIAPSTLDQLWSRHLADSAQLVPLAPASGSWVDIGTGGGFPGLVIALLRREPIVLVEPRRLRAAFLTACVEQLGLTHAVVVATPVEQYRASAAIVSARAVASIEKLLHAGRHCATTATRWLLPRGRLDEAELVAVQQRWAGVFHVEQSVTDPASRILVIDGGQPRGRR